MELRTTDVGMLDRLRDLDLAEDTWTTFNALYRDIIHKWCRRNVPHHQAEDLTQEILLKLLVELPKYEHDPARGRFRSWLKTVVSNTLRDYHRRESRQPHFEPVEQPALQNVAISQVADDHTFHSSDGTEISSAALAIKRVRRRVTSQSWEIFCDVAFGESTTAEIASRYQLSVSAVHKARYRVAKALRQEYERLLSPIEWN